MANWFADVFGFREAQDYEQVRSSFCIETDADTGDIVLTTVPKTGERRSFYVGKFDMPSVVELRDMLVTPKENMTSMLTFDHIVADVAHLHRSHPGAVFQVASQFNCLEMPGPNTRPEHGITDYYLDRTQGPQCAISCPAGILYRNYFVNGHGQGGLGNQLDTLKHLGEYLGNTGTTTNGGDQNDEATQYWTMQNGYALPVHPQSIAMLRRRIAKGEVNMDSAVQKLRVGVHWSTEVTPPEQQAEGPHCVTQVYCSALPVAYTNTPMSDWKPFCRMVLDGTYEATLAVAAIIAHQRQERVSVYLTKVGGGAFGNDEKWISDAINKAIRQFKSHPLDVYLVHYRAIEHYYLSAIVHPDVLLADVILVADVTEAEPSFLGTEVDQEQSCAEEDAV
jgi:hypothetical protein